MGEVTWQERALVALGAAALLAVTVGLVHRRRLREGYAVLWALAGLVLLALAAFPPVSSVLAGWLGLDRAVLLALGLGVFAGAMALHYAVVVSRRSSLGEDLAREVASLKEEVECLRGELKEARRPPPEVKPKPPVVRT
jgi:hypothetical protein